MATLGDIGVSAAINILSAFIFLLAFAFLRLQPFNDRVYFPKWYLRNLRTDPTTSGAFVSKFVNLDFRSYIRFLNWMPEALKMPEPALIEHAGLDSAVYLRIYLLGLKIFVPIAFLAWSILVPVNWTNSTLEDATKFSNVTASNIDKLSISNIPTGSQRFWSHILMAYAFTFWTCYVLMKEYETVALMRLQFLASEKRRPDQFTVLVRNVPSDPDESTSELVEHFFLVNHPDHYLTHQVVYDANKLDKLVKKKKKLQNWLVYYQNKSTRKSSQRPFMKTGFLGLWGKKVDAIDHHVSEVEKLSKEIAVERERIASNPKSIMPAAFVSFKTRWGAAVCAQTQQSRNPTLWLTEWAPEPRDIYWQNLAIPYVSLTVRRLIIAVAFFFLTFFFMIPIAFVQSLATIEGIEKAAPFLKSVIEIKFIKSVIQGFLPGIALKLFLIFLPTILMIMSKFEGYNSLSSLERISASRYYLFNFVNVFLGSIIAGSAFEQLDSFIHQSANEIPKTIGVAIPMRATFFITYIMVDGWAGIAGEILMLKPLIMYHLKNFFLVKTEKDREEAMDPGSLGFNTGEPRIQFYFLLGLVYATVTPIILPFIIIFFGLAYVVFRHQVKCTNMAYCSDKGVTVVITDSGSSDRTDFILSRRAFGRMAQTTDAATSLYSLGVVDIDYRRVSCSYPNKNITIKIDENSNYPYYLAFAIWYQQGKKDITAVQLCETQNFGCKLLDRSYGAVWTTTSPPSGPLSLRMLFSGADEDDQSWVVPINNIPQDWKAGQTYDTGVQVNS